MSKVDVFFAKVTDGCSVSDQVKATKQVLNSAVGFDSVMDKIDKVGVKIHVGELNNDTHIPAEAAKAVCSRIKRNGAFPFLTETSTLYKGRRANAIDHLNHAYSQGFTPQNTGAPFIMADGLTGDSEIDVEIPGKLYDKVSIARDAVITDSLIIMTHVTGHMVTGMGAGLKNLGMGLASRKGKLRQHSSMKPLINPAKCTYCKVCMKWCPESAITTRDEKAFILQEKCIGCGECFAVCKFDSVKYNWETTSSDLQKKIVEHAMGIVKQKKDKIFYLHYLINMTTECDCMNIKQERIIPDIGVLGSTDIVALDQASIDLTEKTAGTNIGRSAYPNLDPLIQLEYAAELGLGSREYNLVEL